RLTTPKRSEYGAPVAGVCTRPAVGGRPDAPGRSARDVTDAAVGFTLCAPAGPEIGVAGLGAGFPAATAPIGASLVPTSRARAPTTNRTTKTARTAKTTQICLVNCPSARPDLPAGTA